MAWLSANLADGSPTPASSLMGPQLDAPLMLSGPHSLEPSDPVRTLAMREFLYHASGSSLARASSLPPSGFNQIPSGDTWFERLGTKSKRTELDQMVMLCVGSTTKPGIILSIGRRILP